MHYLYYHFLSYIQHCWMYALCKAFLNMLSCIWAGCIPLWWIFHSPDIPRATKTLTTTRQNCQKSPKRQQGASLEFPFMSLFKYTIAQLVNISRRTLMPRFFHLGSLLLSYRMHHCPLKTSGSLVLYILSLKRQYFCWDWIMNRIPISSFLFISSYICVEDNLLYFYISPLAARTPNNIVNALSFLVRSARFS